MHPNKNPGPDGMTLGFCQKFWSTVGGDVVKVVEQFLEYGWLYHQLIHANIAPIPK